MDIVLAYLQVLSDSGTARTPPLRWPEERGETALRLTSLSTGNDKQARKGVARGGGAGIRRCQCRKGQDVRISPLA